MRCLIEETPAFHLSDTCSWPGLSFLKYRSPLWIKIQRLNFLVICFFSVLSLYIQAQTSLIYCLGSKYIICSTISAKLFCLFTIRWPINLTSCTKSKFSWSLHYKTSHTQGQVHWLTNVVKLFTKRSLGIYSTRAEHFWSKWPEWWLQNSHWEAQVWLLRTKVVWVQLFVWDPLRALL